RVAERSVGYRGVPDEPVAASLFTTMGAGAAGGGAGASAPWPLPWMASNTSWRCTGTSFGATMPSRTLSPRISTTVTVMSLLMTILSFFFLDSTNIAAYPSWRETQFLENWFPRHRQTGKQGCTTRAPVKIPFSCRNQRMSLG